MDKISPAQRSENMRRIKSGGMKPEILVRQIAHRLGYRFRLHRHDLPGRPDLVFPQQRKIVFVHGCFWHSHSKATCHRKRTPKSNLEYWLPKLARNHKRDRHNLSALRKLGWETLVIWECDTEKNAERVESCLKRFLRNDDYLSRARERLMRPGKRIPLERVEKLITRKKARQKSKPS